MPAEALLLALLNIPVFMLGVLLARRVIDERNVDERRRLEEDMTRKVRMRYRAYLELEQQVERIFKRLDSMETQTEASLNQTRVHLRQLDAVVTAVESGETPRPVEQEVEAAADGFFDQAASDMHEVRAEDFEQYPEGIEAWQSKLENVREEKRQEIERLGLEISNLTRRVEGLSKGEAKGRLDRELQLWQQKYMNLERASTSEVAEILKLREESETLTEKLVEVEARVAEWKQKHDALAVAKEEREKALTARVTELEPHVEAAEFARQEAAQWSARCRDETRKREQEVHNLEQRIKELEPLRSQMSSMETDRVALQQTLASRDGQIRDLAGRLEEARERVSSLEGHDSTQRSEIARLEERLRTVKASFEEQQASAQHWKAEYDAAHASDQKHIERARALETEAENMAIELGSLRQEHEATLEHLRVAEASLEQAREELAELERRHEIAMSENGEVYSSTIAELKAAQDACEELQSKYDGAMEQSQRLEHELATMRTANDELRRTLAETSESVQGQNTRISSLMADLDGARREVQAKSSLVQAAEIVLSELKPKLEALESQLHHDESKGQD